MTTLAPEPTQPRGQGPGAYSRRLADLDQRLDDLYVLQGEHAARLGYIGERLTHVETLTRETNAAIARLMGSIQRHPLLSKFLGS